MTPRRVVITGCGVISPVGIGKKAFWESIRSGRSGIIRITQFDAEKFASQIAGEVKDFDPSCVLPPKEIKRTARFVQFALVAAKEAVEDSGLDFQNTNPYRAGVIIGSGVGSLLTVEREHKKYLANGPQKLSPFLIPRLITNEAAGSVAIQFRCKGVNFCTVTACASGAHAIGEAYRVIQQDKADIVICGGTESCITPLGIGGFCALKALSTRNDAPKKASRPFDKDRDGFIMAEGAGILVLEERTAALKRGAHIYGEIAGYGATCDAYHITAPDPEGNAPAYAMKLALDEGEIVKNQPIYINAHGTSTVLNDVMETKAIKKVFGDSVFQVAVSSTKSMIGHTLGAAGAIECIVCAFALQEKCIPPTINYETPDPECDLDYTPNKSREMDFKVALSNSLGFGGHNASLVIKEHI